MTLSFGIIAREKSFNHNGDIPLKSHIHFGMFALKTTLLENSEGTEQKQHKASLGLFCKIKIYN